MKANNKPGRPSTGRSERIAAFITPEQLEYLTWQGGSFGETIGRMIDLRILAMARKERKRAKVER